MKKLFICSVLTGILSAYATTAIHAIQPEIIQFSWGKTAVLDSDGTIKHFKDCILTPTGSFVWDWSKTGTRHVPGTQVADVHDFVNSADIFILTLGVDQVLQIKPDTITFLESRGKKVHCDATRPAIELYKQLVAAGNKVVIVLHSTC